MPVHCTIDSDLNSRMLSNALSASFFGPLKVSVLVFWMNTKPLEIQRQQSLF